MKLQDLPNMDKNDVLALLGLQTKNSDAGRLLGTLGTFGIGLLVGAGVALLLAPKSGTELRQDLRAQIGRDGKVVAANGNGGSAGDVTGRPV
jgi:hypothetical protein